MKKAKKVAPKKSSRKTSAQAGAFSVGQRVKVLRGEWGNCTGAVVESLTVDGYALVQLDQSPRSAVEVSPADLVAL